MLEPWVIYVLIFLSVAFCVYLTQIGVREVVERQRRASERFAALDPSPLSEIDGLRRQRSGGFAWSWIATLRVLVLQSGTELKLTVLAGYFIVVWLVLVVVPLPWALGVRVITAAIAAAGLIYGYLSFKRARRIARFAEQLPDVLDVMVRSLRAGHPLPVSLSLVAREMPKPAGPEFAAVVDEINYGRSVSEALGMLAKRIGYRELRFLVSAVTIAQQTGGNLNEILSRLAKMLRDRFKLKRRVRALSAEGRFSGVALSSLPIVLFGLINFVSPAYYEAFWQSPARTTVLLIAGALLLVGNIAIYKLVHFKV